MRYIIRLHPEAQRELREARDYYREIDIDLAVRLLTENDVAIRYLAGFPEAGAPLFETYRHVVLPHFPYMLVYAVAPKTVNILAVFHLRRDPAWMRQQLTSRPTNERRNQEPSCDNAER